MMWSRNCEETSNWFAWSANVKLIEIDYNIGLHCLFRRTILFCLKYLSRPITNCLSSVRSPSIFTGIRGSHWLTHSAYPTLTQVFFLILIFKISRIPHFYISVSWCYFCFEVLWMLWPQNYLSVGSSLQKKNCTSFLHMLALDEKWLMKSGWLVFALRKDFRTSHLLAKKFITELNSQSDKFLFKK